jgi:tripartite-type tricarboxylate transporter receptor subunit TctC
MSPLRRPLPSAFKAIRRLPAWVPGLLAFCLLALPTGCAAAQNYPTRPVRWVVGFSAGGSTDIIARIVSAWLQERLGQPFLIEDKPGPAATSPPRRW